MDPRSLNRYAYAHGNPVNYQDPSGHDPATAEATLQEGWNFYMNMASADGIAPIGDVIGLVGLAVFGLYAGTQYLDYSESAGVIDVWTSSSTEDIKKAEDEVRAQTLAVTGRPQVTLGE